MNTVLGSISNKSVGGNTRMGVGLCLMSMFIFAAQDGITKTLVKDLPVAQLIMVRYWFFLVFALCFVQMRGGLVAAVKTAHPWLQAIRSMLGVFEIFIFGHALRHLGLAETHAIYAVFPLLAMAMAALVLDERISVRQVLAAFIGFVGTLIILQPGRGVFSEASLIPLAAAVMFAWFNVLTRKISRVDAFGTNMLYMGLWGAVLSTVVGAAQWTTPTQPQMVMMAVLSVTGVVAQLLLLQALKYTAAVTLQPFNYSLLVFASVLGVIWFGEVLTSTLVVGALLVVLGGIFAVKR